MRGVKCRSLEAIGLLGVLLWLGGCAAKSDEKIYRQLQGRRADFAMLQQTQRAFFPHGEGNTTVAIVTYLPQASKEKEIFILSTYPPDELQVEKVKLGDTLPERIEKLTQKELPAPLRKHTPNWFASYRLLFPHTASKKLPIHLEDKTGQSQTLLFIKGPKYLVTHPRF
jgi:hypothetical protein